MFRSKRTQRDYEAEIQAHIQLESDRLSRQGLSDRDAYYAACRAFGNLARAQERFYESRRWMWWDRLRQDIHFSLRMLRKAPGFTTVAVLTLALGIGATTAIFSIVDAALLHPLPFPKPEQLVSIQADLPGVGAQDIGISVPEWHDLESSGAFQYVSPIGGGDVNLTGSAEPARVRFLNVPPNYFALLGAEPQLGRSFNPEDRTPGFLLEGILSDGLWKRAFGGDRNILGKNLRLDNDLYQIIGVMPPGFHDPGRTADERNIDVWLASGFAADPAPPPLRGSRFLAPTIARMTPGLTLARAQSRVDALVASLRKQYPADYPAQSEWTVRLVPLKETVVGNVRQSLILLLSAVALVLLIACVNVAGLLFARASGRGRELAVRSALGAARSRLIRQLLTESFILSLLGGIAGLALLFSLKALLLRSLPENLPRLNEISINQGVLVFALTITVSAGLIFGLAPALQAGRQDLTHVLNQEGRGSSGSREQARTRYLLVVTEFGLSLVLMIAAGLLVHSFWHLLNAPLGFDPRNVMSVRTWLPIPNDPNTDPYRRIPQEAALAHEILLRGSVLPGVEEFALGNSAAIPLNHTKNLLPLIFEGRETVGGDSPLAEEATVTPGYFHLMSISLLEGRLFSDSDDDKSPAIAVINDAFASRYWPGENPIGKRLRFAVGSPWITVAGVVASGRTESLEAPNVPLIYQSLYQRRAKDLALFLRGKLNAAAIPAQVRQAVQSVDPELPVFKAQTFDDILSASLAERRFSMEMIGLFALTALLLAGMGIYGVISYVVGERKHEIGIRLALGAQSRDVMRMVLRQGLRLALTGCALGLICAVIVSHLMAGLLYGVSPTDPAAFAGVVLVLVGVALLACYVPARRAMKLDATVALRHD